MGMYDKEPTFEDHFTVGDRFVVLGMRYVGTINTRHGEAEKVLITAVTRDSYPSRTTYSALGVGFANMAQRAEASDFPHVAEYIRVALGRGKEVKRFARVDVTPRAFVEGDDGPPLTPEQLGDEIAASFDQPADGGGGDDIPF